MRWEREQNRKLWLIFIFDIVLSIVAEWIRRCKWKNSDNLRSRWSQMVKIESRREIFLTHDEFECEIDRWTWETYKLQLCVTMHWKEKYRYTFSIFLYMLSEFNSIRISSRQLSYSSVSTKGYFLTLFFDHYAITQ
jgi:hypothetical protein